MSDRMRREPFKILLVDDAPSQIRLMEEALKTAAVPYRMNVAATGDDALSLLSRSGTPRPDIVLLDLNLPGKSGHEVLQEIKSRPETACIPVIVMSSSLDASDVAGAYASRANCYITKPNGFDELVAMVRSIAEFWFHLVRLPPDGAQVD